MSAVDDLRTAMISVGLHYYGPLYADGQLHRFRVEGDHAPNSWYVFRTRPFAAGIFGCWKREMKRIWCEPNPRVRSAAEQHEVRLSWMEAQKARQCVEAGRQRRALHIARYLLARSKPADATHPYLVRKGVKPYGDLRQQNDRLVIPLRNAIDELQTVQFIAPDARFGGDGDKRDKHFLRGGRTAGAFFVLCEKPDGPLVICEGYATGASIHEATGYAVACAMNCGNLAVVANALRLRWRHRAMVIAADNDQWNDHNPGVRRAVEAAKAVQARVAVPRFKNIVSRPTDFNDLHALEGLSAVKSQIEWHHDIM
jgi:putative DNA primase/helicase